MAWTSGTAADYRDLLEQVMIFASANHWKVEKWHKEDIDPLYPSEGEDELYLSSEGPSGQEYFMVAIKTTYHRIEDRYNWKLIAGPQFSQGSSFEAQPNATTEQFIYLWQGEIDYHLFVDPNRIIVLAQVSGTTHVCYLGKLQNYCSLGHWPRQFGCFGEGVNAAGRWSSQGNDYSHLQWFRNSARQVLWVDGAYLTPSRIWPTMSSTCLMVSGQVYDDGSHWSLPMTVVHDTHGALGEFIGCYYIDGHNVSTGQVITTNDPMPRTFVVVQNIYRNGYRDFMAIERA